MFYRTVLVLALVLSCCSFQKMVFAQEVVREAARLEAVTAEVISYDWVGGKVVLKWQDFDGNNQQAAFNVPEDLQIQKGTETISANDIEVGDSVRVEYYGDFMNEPKVVSMSVVNDQSGGE